MPTPPTAPLPAASHPPNENLDHFAKAVCKSGQKFCRVGQSNKLINIQDLFLTQRNCLLLKMTKMENCKIFKRLRKVRFKRPGIRPNVGFETMKLFFKIITAKFLGKTGWKLGIHVCNSEGRYRAGTEQTTHSSSPVAVSQTGLYS